MSGKKRRTKRSNLAQVIENPRSIEEMVEEVAKATLRSVADAFGPETIGKFLFEELKEDEVEPHLWPEKVTALVESMEKLQNEIIEKTERIAAESGFSKEIIEIMLHAPFFEEHIAEHITIGDTTIIAKKDERRPS